MNKGEYLDSIVKNLDLFKVIGNCNFYNYCQRNFGSKYHMNILDIYYIFLLILMYVFSVKGREQFVDDLHCFCFRKQNTYFFQKIKTSLYE